MSPDGELFLDPAFSPSLSHRTSLTSLDLSNSWSGVGPTFSFEASHSAAAAVTQFLPSLSSLQALFLRSCLFHFVDFVPIVQSFSHLPLLQSIAISEIDLDYAVVEPLLVALLQVRDLRLLTLFFFLSSIP